MPHVFSDWKDEAIPLVDTAGAAMPTTGWELEMHVRKKVGASPAALKLKTSDGTLLTGQATASGTTNGIKPNVAASLMVMAPGSYVWDIKRLDGGRNEWLMGGDLVFEEPVTVPGLP